MAGRMAGEENEREWKTAGERGSGKRQASSVGVSSKREAEVLEASKRGIPHELRGQRGGNSGREVNVHRGEGST